MKWLLTAVLGAATLWSTAMIPPLHAAEDVAPSKPTGGKAQRLLRQALQAEIAGDNSLRARILDEALQIEPQLAPARWHAGQIRLDGRWLSVRESQEEAARDEKLRQYRQLRARSNGSVRSQMNLARWCQRNGLPETARAHWVQVLLVEPKHGAALSALDVCWQDGALVTRDEAAATKREAERQQEQVEAWSNQAKQWVQAVVRGTPEEREATLRAVESLGEVDEALALVRAAAEVDEPNENLEELHLAMVRRLGQLSSDRAGPLLLDYALSLPHETSRKAAVYELRQQPWHRYVPYLLNQLQTPLEVDSYVSEVGGGVTNSYVVSRETPAGERYSQTFYDRPRTPRGPRYAPTYTFDHVEPGYTKTVRRRTGPCWCCFVEELVEVPARNVFKYSRMSETELPEYRAQKSLAYELARRDTVKAAEQVAAINAALDEHNRQIGSVLTELTGVEQEPTARAWWDWWQQYLSDNPEARHAVLKNRMPLANLQVNHPPGSFPAGTLVWTRTGPVPIQHLVVGDEALSQDPETGELAYKAIAYIGPVGSIAMRDIPLGPEDRLLTAPDNPIWVTGRGWQVARDLEPGTLVRGFNGSRSLGEQREGGAHPAYRLMVLDFHTLFVGREGLLVHDAAPVEFTDHILPGVMRN